MPWFKVAGVHGVDGGVWADKIEIVDGCLRCLASQSDNPNYFEVVAIVSAGSWTTVVAGQPGECFAARESIVPRWFSWS